MMGTTPTSSAAAEHAATVREALHGDRTTDPVENWTAADTALDDLVALAERATELERENGQAWTEYNDSESARMQVEARAERAEAALREANGLIAGLLNGGMRVSYEWAITQADWFYVSDLRQALGVTPTHANNYARLLTENGLLVRERGDTPPGGGRTFRYRAALARREARDEL